MTALTRKVRAGAPAPDFSETRHDTDHDALEGMQRTAAEQEAAALWKRRNTPNRTTTSAESAHVPKLDLDDWLGIGSLVVFAGLAGYGLYLIFRGFV